MNELYHYGVMGMHWGVRKAYDTSSATTYTPRQAAQNKYDNINNSYADAKKKAASNKAYKRTPEYKKAVKNYKAQNRKSKDPEKVIKKYEDYFVSEYKRNNTKVVSQKEMNEIAERFFAEPWDDIARKYY